MLNFIWPLLILCSFIYAIISGNIERLNNSIFESLEEVITLSMTLVGTMCLWCGIIQIANKTSIIEKLTKILKPLIRIIFFFF